MNKVILIIFIVLIFITGCSNPENTEKSNKETNIIVGEIKEFSIIAKQWEFNPKTIEVNQGDKVKLNIKSIDVTHGFTLPDFGVNSRLNPEQTTVVEFIADKTGTFSFFCSVQCGFGHENMSGQLIVN